MYTNQLGHFQHVVFIPKYMPFYKMKRDLQTLIDSIAVAWMPTSLSQGFENTNAQNKQIAR